MEIKVLLILTLTSWSVGLANALISSDSACQDKFQGVDSVEEMLNIVESVRLYRQQISSSEKPEKRQMDRCLDEYDSIDELGKLISYNGDVCHPKHVDRILAYHDSFIHVSPLEGVKHPLTKNKRMTRNFFRRYALQVALICRKNAVENLRQVSHQFEPDQWKKVLPWRALPEFASGKIMIDEVKTSGSKNAVERLMVDLIESIETIDQLTDLMQITAVSVPMSSEPLKVLKKEMYEENGVNEVQGDAKISSTIEECNRFASFYSGQILSVVRLANAGYRWWGPKLKDPHDMSASDQELLGDWVKVTQSCTEIRKNLADKDQSRKPNIIYHEFKTNHWDTNAKLISTDFIKSNAMSQSTFSSNERLRKMARISSRLIGTFTGKSITEKDSLSGLRKLKEYLDIQSGDRISKDGLGGAQLNGKVVIIMAFTFIGVLFSLGILLRVFL